MLPSRWQAMSLPLAVTGVVLVVIAWALLVSMAEGREGDKHLLRVFFHSYLANFMYVLSFGIGGLFLTLVSFLTRAGWNASIRRLAEILAATLPWLSLLLIPILLTLFIGDGALLYEWNGPALEGLVAMKTGYLNASFFMIRSAIYVLLWTFMALWYFGLSVRQDETKDIESTLRRQYWSGPLIMVFALSVSFASWDWLMSIDADWYSTIFGVYYFAASMFGLFAFMIGAYLLLQRAGCVRQMVTIEHYHDMAKFLFGFVMFWSYIAFSQLLLIWYANIPEETIWYRYRWEGGWWVFSYALLATHFAIPLLGLLSLHVRRNRFGLAFWSVWALVVHWMDLTFLVMPNIATFTGWMLLGHAVLGVGMFCIFLALVILRATNVPLVTVGDPRLHEALSYSNPIL